MKLEKGRPEDALSHKRGNSKKERNQRRPHDATHERIQAVGLARAQQSLE